MTSKTDLNAAETPEGAETVCPTCKGAGWVGVPDDSQDERCGRCQGTDRLTEKGS